MNEAAETMMDALLEKLITLAGEYRVLERRLDEAQQETNKAKMLETLNKDLNGRLNEVQHERDRYRAELKQAQEYVQDMEKAPREAMHMASSLGNMAASYKELQDENERLVNENTGLRNSLEELQKRLEEYKLIFSQMISPNTCDCCRKY